MAFHPDILIATPDGTTVVVEAKVTLPNLERTEEDIKHYMVQTQCPVGLLITPERMWLYRDSYTSQSSQSVRLVGEFNAGTLWPQPPPSQAIPFENFVQHWLEDLGTGPVDKIPKELREAFQDYVWPALMDVDVRAAHPRYA